MRSVHNLPANNGHGGFHAVFVEDGPAKPVSKAQRANETHVKDDADAWHHRARSNRCGGHWRDSKKSGRIEMMNAAGQVDQTVPEVMQAPRFEPTIRQNDRCPERRAAEVERCFLRCRLL